MRHSVTTPAVGIVRPQHVIRGRVGGYHERKSSNHLKGSRGLVSAMIAVLCAGQAFAGPSEQAKRIFDRVAGVPPSATELATMSGYLQSGDTTDAVNVALNARRSTTRC